MRIYTAPECTSKEREIIYDLERKLSDVMARHFFCKIEAGFMTVSALAIGLVVGKYFL